jgi:hypothetical protein
MQFDDRTSLRSGLPFIAFTLTLGIPCLMAGCGGDSSSKPAPIDQSQQKKVQEYLGGYKEQLIAQAKSQAKAKAKAKDEGKKSH